MVEIQGFEKDALDEKIVPTVHSHSLIYKPLMSVLSEPIDILHCESIESISAFSKLSGRWSQIKARAGKPSSSREYSVRAGPMAVGGTTLYLFKDGNMVSEVQTDEGGKAAFNLPSNKPASDTYTVSLLPELTPIIPLQDIFQLSIWAVTCQVRNLTDRWWRLAGRSFAGDLPRIFWKKPGYTIGLAAPLGAATARQMPVFIDLVPVFGDQSMTLEYGISAFCNTPNPYPTQEECKAARKNTWWEFTVEGFNGKSTKSVKGKLNIDRHLRVSLTADNITAEVIVPEGAQT